MRNVTRTCVCVAFIALVATTVVPARATLPGTNGRIVYVRGCCSQYGVYAIDADGTNKVALTDLDVFESAGSPAWSPSGRKIAFSARRYVAGFPHIRSFEIYLMRPDGSHVTRLTHTRTEDFDPAWSPDGTKLVWVRDGDLFTMAPDGTGRQRLTDTRKEESDPAWSPDGQEIAFTRHYSGNLYLIHPDGSGLERLTATAGWAYGPRWFPDGSKLVYEVWTDVDDEFFFGDASVWTIDLTTKVATAVLDEPGINQKAPIISPDGTKMAWVRQTPNPDPVLFQVTELIVSDLDGSNASVLDTCQLNCGFGGIDWGRA